MTRIILTPMELALIVLVFASIFAYVTHAATAYWFARRHQRELHQLIQLAKQQAAADRDWPFVDYAGRYLGDPE